MIKIGVLNISDRASAGVYEDTPGKACVALLREWLATPFETDYKVIPDERAIIAAELQRMAEEIAEWSPQFLDVDPVHGMWFALFCERRGIRPEEITALRVLEARGLL